MTPKTMSTARRGARALALLTGVVLVLSGCVAMQIPAETTPPERVGESSAPVTEGVPDELLTFYDQELEWGSCGTGFECTTVVAPLDWNAPDTGEIDLAVIRQTALSGEPEGSLLTNPGGPGGSKEYTFVLDNIDYVFGEPLQQSYDIVGWDPRGVGESTAVRCFDPHDMDAFLYDIPEGERGSEEWDEETEQRAEAFAEACDENTGELLEFVTTEQSSRDLDLLRGVLGEEELDYLGFSYGTFLGATYAKNFPDRVGRLVLDGAIDPAATGEDVGMTQAAGFESALRSYMQACLDGETGAACPFTGTVDDAMSDLGVLLASVDASPLRSAGDERLLGADALMTAVIVTLYNQASWTALTSALTTTLSGDGTEALYLADAYNGRTPEGTYADNSTEAFSAYNCMDYPDASDVDAEDTEARVAEVAPTIAPYWSGASVCEDWPYEPTGVRAPIQADGADPILVVGTTGDPATPYEWSESLAEQLSSGVLLTYEGEGHTAYGGASSCINETVESYLLDGTLPDDGTRCR